MSDTGDQLLPATAKAVDTQVAHAQSTGRVPTLAAAVVRAGELVHLTSAGGYVGGEPIGTDTQCRIGSITKTMTAALVLQLRDEGRLTLDDLLYRHLPGTAVGGVTLRQLLGHISGLQREPDGDWWERAAGQDLATLLDGVGPDKLAHPPYHGHHYSNLAYGLLGAALQRISGQAWPELVDKRLLTPLGMRRTTYHPQEPFVRGYVVHPWHGTLREEPRHDSRAMAPAGQLWSTLADLGRWADFLAAPEPAVLAPATLAQMCVPVTIHDPQTWTAGHGLGLALWRRGERVYTGHAGSMPGYLSVLAVHRPSRTGVVAFANAYTLRGGGLAGLGTRLLSTVLDREPPAPPPWRPAAEPPPPGAGELCGRWWWMGREHEVRWDAEAAELVIAPLTVPGEPWRFRPERDGAEAAGRWRGVAGMNDGELLVVHRAAGEVVALEIATLIFTRTPEERSADAAAG